MNIRQKLYATTKEISDTLNLKRDVFFDTKILLMDNNLLSEVAGRDLRGKGTSAGTAVKVLDHILARTIPYNKTIEYITAEEIAQGMPKLSIPSAGVSQRTIARCLPVLEREGYLIRLTTNWGKSVLYGLNLPYIINRLQRFFEGVDIKPNTTASRQKERLGRLIRICNWLQKWYNRIKEMGNIALWEIDKKIKELREWGRRNMANLKEAIKTVKETKTQRQVKGYRSSGAKPILEEEKEGEVKVRPKRALDLWHSIAMQTGDYPGYAPLSTGKIIGQMKHWINELKKQGLDEEQLRSRISVIVENWKKIKDRQFLTIEKNMSRTTPRFPDFNFYFVHRREMAAFVNPFFNEERELEIKARETVKRKRISSF